jgi:ABC-2 type transport system permease protein
MLKKAWEITRLYLKTTYSSRTVLLFQLVMPILFTFLIGVGTGGFNEVTTTSTGVVWEIGVVNEDDGLLGAVLGEMLGVDPALAVREITLEPGIAAIETNELLALLVIPPNFSTAVQDGGELAIDMYSDAEDVRQVQPVQELITGIIGQLQGSAAAANVSRDVADSLELFTAGNVDRQDYYADALNSAQEAWATPPVVVEINEDERVIIAENVIPDGIDQSSPGMMAMFATFGMVGGAAVIIQERQQGTLRRLLVMPIHKSSIIVGKMLGILLTGLAQMIILIIFGALAFDVAWGNSLPALAVMVFSFALAITSLGMMFAALTRTLAQANALSTVIVLSISALGGAWWPLDIVPGWMQVLGRLSPISWAMTGFHDIITRGQGVAGVLPEAGVLLVFSAVFLTIGIARFRFD